MRVAAGTGAGFRGTGMSTVAGVLLGKERRMVARFVALGAVTSAQALTLEQLDIRPGVILRRLRERAVVREAAREHYYVDVESWRAVQRGRRRAVHVVAAIALALLLALIFGTRRAGAEAGALEPGLNTHNSLSG
jgi:hypothetical protein